MILRDLPFDIVELVPCEPPSIADAPLRETTFRADAWLPEEIDRLRTFFADGQSLPEIATSLGRTLAATGTKVADLGLRRNSTRPWSDLEDAELARRHGIDANSAIAAEFGRSPAAIRHHARLLGLTEGHSPRYTEWDLAQIRAGYEAAVPVGQIATLIGRPVSGVASIASAHGIRHANHSPGWSDAEQHRALALAEERVRYPDIAAILAAEGFPRRQKGAVGQMLRKLGYERGWGRPWIAEEDDLIRAAYAGGDSLTPLRAQLKRTVSSIRYRVGELGLQGSHDRPNGWRTEPAWTDEQIAILRRDYGKVPTPDLAASLGRRKGGVLQKAFALGLKHGFRRAFNDQDVLAIRVAHTHGVSLTDLSDALGRDPAVVSKHAIRLGIPFSDRSAKAPRTRRAPRPWLSLADLIRLGETADGAGGRVQPTMARPRLAAPEAQTAPSRRRP